MVVERLVDGLWRWTARHPDWRAGADWEPEVGCVYYEAPDAIVLVDPLVPDDEPERFFRALDRDVERLGLPVVTLVTCGWHERSAEPIAARYAARTVRPTDHGAPLPDGVIGVATPTAGEVVYWLAGGRAVVPGDTLLPDGAGGVRVCPADWLDGEDVTDETVGRLVEELRPLLELPVERVLLSHGAPVASDGLAALRRALGEQPTGPA